MANGNGRQRAHKHDQDGFPADLARWIAIDGSLLDALITVRRLGDEGSEALAALNKIRRVAELRLSWQLWAALAEGDGDEPELLLLEVLPLGVLDHARRALWGSSVLGTQATRGHRLTGRPRRV
jgi:hypothetical protein